MLSIPQIRNLVSAGAHERLIDRVLAGGRSGNLALRLRLTSPEAAAPAALGLALQRVCELSYAPSPFASELSSRLVGSQDRDGFFAGDGALDAATAEADTLCLRLPARTGSCLAASAVAARGLVDFQRQRAEAGLASDPALDAAIARAMFAFASAQREDGSISVDPVEDAIILWQVGSVLQFRTAIRFADFREAVEAQGEAAAQPDLLRLAHSIAA